MNKLEIAARLIFVSSLLASCKPTNGNGKVTPENFPTPTPITTDRDISVSLPSLEQFYGLTAADIEILKPKLRVPNEPPSRNNSYLLTETDLRELSLKIKQLPVEADILKLCEKISSGEMIEKASGNLDWPLFDKGFIWNFFNLLHPGLDIDKPVGTPVMAADGGLVVGKFESNNGYGYHIFINHGLGRLTLYAHLSEISVQLGEEVEKRSIIGKVGSTGRSTGPHLHFGVIEKDSQGNCQYINPSLLLP